MPGGAQGIGGGVTDRERALVAACRRQYEEARDAPPGTYPPREPGVSEARARYLRWRWAVGLMEETE